MKPNNKLEDKLDKLKEDGDKAITNLAMTIAILIVVGKIAAPIVLSMAAIEVEKVKGKVKDLFNNKE